MKILNNIYFFAIFMYVTIYIHVNLWDTVILSFLKKINIKFRLGISEKDLKIETNILIHCATSFFFITIYCFYQFGLQMIIWNIIRILRGYSSIVDHYFFLFMHVFFIIEVGIIYIAFLIFIILCSVCFNIKTIKALIFKEKKK